MPDRFGGGWRSFLPGCGSCRAAYLANSASATAAWEAESTRSARMAKRRFGSLMATASSLALLLPAIGLVAPTALYAQTWTGPGTDYNTATNWSTNTVPIGAGQTATFTNTGPTSVNLSAGTGLDGFTFNAGAQAYTIGTSGAFFIFGGAGVTNSSSNVQNFNASGGVFQFDGSSTAGTSTVYTASNGGEIAFFQTSSGGSAQINLNGAALLGVALSSGGLSIGSLAGTNGDVVFSTLSGGATTQSLTVGSLNTSTTFAGGIIEGGAIGSLTKVGTGTLTLTGNNSYQGGTNLNAGTIAVGSDAALGTGALTMADGTTLQAAANVSLSNAIGLNGTNTIDTNGNALALSGIISGTGVTLDKIGTGTLTLSGTNAYSGTTTLNAGTIAVANNAALGTSTLSMATGTTLQAGAAGLMLSNAIGLNGTNTIDTNGNALALSGIISGTGVTLDKIGTGTLTLSGVNTYTGGTTISGGTVAVSADHNLGANTGGLTFNGGTLQFGASFDLANTRAITLNAGGGTFDTNGFNTTLSQAIAGPGGSLTKTGFGTLTLSGLNTYTGATTIDGGTLAVSGSIASSSITNNSGLIFFDTSTAGSATITNNVNATIQFQDTSTAGNAAITNNRNLSFTDSSTAGNASILNNAVVDFFNASTAGNATIIENGFLVFHDTSTAGDASITNNGGTGMSFRDTSTAGNATIINNFGLAFVNSSTAGNATIATNSGGTTFIQDAASGGTARFILNGTGALDISGLTTGGTTAGSIEGSGNVGLGANTLTAGGNNLSTTFSGVIQDGGVSGGTGGSLVKIGTGTLTLSGVNTYTGATTVDAGTLRAGGAGAFVGNTAYAVNGGTLDLNGFNLTMSSLSGTGGTVALGAAALAINQATDTSYAGAVTGTGSLTKTGTGTGTLTLSGVNTYTGATTVNGGALQAGAANTFAPSSAFAVAGGATLDLNNFNQIIGSLAGTGGVTFGSASLTAGGDNTSTIYSGIMSGTGGFTKTGSGKLILSGINTYTGATVIDGGTLGVNGDITASNGVTVNAGGTLGGNGVVGTTTVDGGTLAPGNSIGLLTVQGSLTFTAAASYMVEVSPSNADRTNVTGVATLGGATVNASFAAGTFVAKQYTIVHATGGVTGAFGSQVNTNLPAGFKSSLSYDGNDAYLNLALNFIPPSSPNFGGGLNGNQAAVGTALVNFFNSAGGIPMVFGSLSPAGLTQASGETATGSQQTTFDAMNLFLGLMTDPFVAGRGEGDSRTGGATGYADEQRLGYAQPHTPNDALAAIYTKAPRPVPFEPRWSVWAAGYGGSQTTSGNAAAGSNNTTSSIYGTAVGADYRFSPDTLAGFALAGGGTNFNVNGAGSGRSDLFQAGAFVRHHAGAAYISAALAYGWQDVTTDRTVTAAGADHLRAEFNANAFSGRVEGGYRFVAPVIGGVGLTPYAAAQVTTFDLPAYAEGVLSGANTFALAYGAKSVTDPRSEIGLRSDKSFALPDAILTLRGRAAWAHDYDPNRAIGATFQTLPGASFVVNGAAQASDSALVTASAEMKWTSGWSTAATFEGEFSDVTESYAGKGVVRYAW
jgi:autotransporter-associated beta strand protein